ncbi:hypothetical protein [Sphingomonas sp.]|nr:hypothetical protein [Sphingomonas sp.]
MPDPDPHPDSLPDEDNDKRADVEQATENEDDAQRGEVRNQGANAQ